MIDAYDDIETGWIRLFGSIVYQSLKGISSQILCTYIMIFK